MFNLFSIFSKPDFEEMKKCVRKFLSDKYQDSFEVGNFEKKIGFYQTTVYPSFAPEKRFPIHVTKKGIVLYDGYLRLIMSQKLEKELKDFSFDYFETEVEIIADIDYLSLSMNNKNLTALEFLRKHNELYATIEFYLNSHSDIDIDIETEKVLNFSEQLIRFGIFNGEIGVWYVKNEHFKNLRSKHEEIVTNYNNLYYEPVDYYNQTKISYGSTYVFIEEGKNDSLESIKENFLDEDIREDLDS